MLVYLPGLVLMSVASVTAEVRPSPSGHYVRFRGEDLLLIGDSGTQCVLQNLNIDYRAWVDDCHEAGIRVVHVWALVAPRQKQDGSVIERRYGYVYPGATPWARREGGPPAADQLPQWDLTRFDEGDDPNKHYWPRLRDLCAYAGERDMVVGITVFFGWPKHNTRERPDWLYHPFNALNGGHLTEDKPMTTVCQEIASPGTEVVAEDWSENWPPAKKTQWVWERFSRELISDTRQYGNTFFAFMDEHSYSEGNCGDHFRDFFRRRGAVWMDWERRRETVDLVMTGTFEATDKNAAGVEGFGREPARPVFHLEGPPYQGDGARTAMWTFAIGGGHHIFHGDERQATVTQGIMGYDPNVVGGDRSPEIRSWVGHCSRFFNEALSGLEGMAPHNELVSEGTAYCLAEPGRAYAAYSVDGEAFALDLSGMRGAATARWHDPRTGAFFPGGEPFAIVPAFRTRFLKPDAGDWALVVAGD